MSREIIENLKKNINTEIFMLREISDYENSLAGAYPNEKAVLEASIRSLNSKIKILNNAIPELLNNISLAKKLPAKAGKTKLERVNFLGSQGKIDVTIHKKDKRKFLKELNIREDLFEKIAKKKVKKKKKEIQEFKKSIGYFKFANKFFLDYSNTLIKKGHFRTVSEDLKKANIGVLSQTYISMILFNTFISFFASLLIFVLVLFFDIGFTGSVFSFYQGSYIVRFVQIFWIPIVIPAFVFLISYKYPSMEKQALATRINQELPFAVIHMSAISGSGIEPSKIFQIIGLSEEYPYLRKEIKKILNQINLYGYDLVTSLNNVSKVTPSKKLAELFSGLSTTISTGGSLTEYFEKRADSLLVSYRLEREKYSKVAETFMDIYISVVIATPMILLLLLVMLSISGIQLGFSPTQIGLLIVSLVAVINIIFLGVMHIKQPSY